MPAGTIRLGEPALRRSEDGRNEVVTNAAGGDISLRSAAALADTIDGPVCAFFLPALAAGRPISATAPLDRTLRENLRGAARIAGDFWGYSGPEPEAPLTDRESSGTVGQFFTGGVDSFYTLRSGLERVRCLINVHGFDIALGDKERLARSHLLLSRVADTLSLQLIPVETDLRRHPLFNSIPWRMTHVAALAMVAHALAPVVGSVRVASSDVPPPWGSHPSLDRLWSSAAVTVVNDELGVRRLDKVKAIADWEPVHHSLKVCWENRTADLNCGFCEKCVRTQAQFAVTGFLGALGTFPPGDLASRIDGIRWVSRALAGQWRDIRDDLDDRRLRAAIDRLLRRSPIFALARNALRSAGVTRKRVRWATAGFIR